MATSPVLDQLKTRATGYIGSKYVGLPGTPTAPAPAPAAPNTPTFYTPPPVNTAPTVARTTLPAPAPAPAAPSAPGADKTWLDWIGSTYGNSKSRGGGFADLPAGTDMSQVIDRYNADTGSQAKYVGGGSGDKVDFGQGAKDVKTAGGQLWYDYGPGGPPGGSGAAGSGGGGGSDPRLHDGIKGNAGSPGAAGAAGAAGAGNFQDQTRALLMQQMQGLSGGVDPNDPSIKAAMDAARLTAEREHQLGRQDLAERMSASGGGVQDNALQQGLQQSRERTAGSLSTLQGDLMMRELTNKRASMAQLLQQALQTGDNESARALQLKLGQMDQQLRQQQLAQQGSQFNDSYGLQVQDAQRQRDLDAARAKAGMNF